MAYVIATRRNFDSIFVKYNTFVVNYASLLNIILFEISQIEETI